MILVPRDTHVLVLRAWREPREIPLRSDQWRLTIEHVGSGRVRSCSEPDQIAAILCPILRHLGVDVPASMAGAAE